MDFYFISHSCHCGAVGNRVPGVSEVEKQLAVGQPLWGSSHGSAPYSLVGPGGLGFLAALPVLYCPGRDREPETQMRAPPRGSMASTQMQAGKLWPKGKKGCVDDTPEGPRRLGLQDRCDGTEGPSWEGPDRCPIPPAVPTPTFMPGMPRSPSLPSTPGEPCSGVELRVDSQ